MNVRVEPIPAIEAEPWILKRHYAHRMPCVEYAFGLFQNVECIGICTFGPGANISNNECGNFKMLELNRLCIAEAAPANAASFFVSHCFALLPQPVLLISYADANAGHVGYVYQATNWFYTGLSEGQRIYIKDGKEYHRKSVFELLGNHTIADAAKKGFIYHTGKPKHRYFYPLGNRKEKKEMLKALPYEILPYPKGTTKRYDASATIETQMSLFGAQP